MRILVSGDCQTAGVTAALRFLCPQHQVDPFIVTADTGNRAALARQLARTHVWAVSLPDTEVTATLDSVRAAHPAPRVVTFPSIFFDAFHPDISYVPIQGPRDGAPRLLQSPAGDYNSAIVVWAWQSGLAPQEAIALFEHPTFEALGYTRRWAPASHLLTQTWRMHDHLDGGRFLRAMRRSGPFMHSINHPRMTALIELARQLAVHIDGNVGATVEEPAENFVVDALMDHVVWPVYPPIADSLGLPGSYTWKLADQRVLRLSDFVHESYDAYRQHDPADVVDTPERAAISAALDALVGGARR